MNNDQLQNIVSLIQEADKLFETVGGSTRHFVRDCLLPLMEEKGISFTFADNNPGKQ